jgi:hypothetical protein
MRADCGSLADLDTVRIEQSYKHPCLFTLTVDAFRSQGGSATSTPQQDLSQWHLPTHDPKNEAKYMYRIHTVDLYFWTADDATMFLDSAKRVVQAQQLQIVANPNAPAPHAEHKNDMMNPVVAKLEKAAISHSSRSPSISTTQSFPGPPTAPPPQSSPPVDNNYAPMAYNPAAPAAPEPIAHREKTPPPLDAADGTGLGAAMHDQHPQHTQQYSNPLQSSFSPQPTTGPYIPGPPSRTQTFSSPSPQGVQRTNTTGSLPPPPQSPPSFAPPPSAPPPSYDSQGPSPQPGLHRQSTQPTQQYANYPGSPGHPPVQSPGFPSHSPLPSPGYAPQQQYQPLASPPPGGFTQYQYSSTTQQTPGTDPYAMHQQLYRPTQQEANVVDNEPTPAQRQSNMGKRAEKVEKGVGKFLKKLDKKF